MSMACFAIRSCAACINPVPWHTCSPLAVLCCAVLQVSEETEEMRFNTAIAAMMEFVNGAYKWDSRPRAAVEPLLLLLAPYAPHIAEELWQVGGLGWG